MSEREASVKLTLDNGQFIVSVRKAGDAVDDVAKKGAKSAGAWTSGLNGAKSALGGLGGKVKEVLGMASGLGAAFSLGSGVQQAVSLRSQFMAIETQINKTGRATVNYRELMAAAQKQGEATGHSTAEMGAAIEQLFAGVGDADFAVGALKHIGDAAKVSRKSVAQMADVAGMLNEKFGATLETLPEMLSVIVEKTDAGGLSLEAMGAKFGLLAGEAADAGFKGTEGLSSVLGMLNTLDDRLGDQSIPAFKKLFQTMKEGSASLKSLQKEAGVKLTPDMSGMDKIRAFMATERGRKAVTSKLGGEARVVFDELSKPFNEAFRFAKDSGKNTKQATEEGLKAFDTAMANMAKHTLTADDVGKRATEMVEKDPAAQLQKASDDFVKAISTPEMFQAMDSLAAKLPQLAKSFAKLVDFAVNNPILAATGAAALAGGGGFAKGAMGSVLSGGGKLLGDAIGGAIKGGSQDAGTSFASKAFAKAGIVGAAAMLGAGIVEAIAAWETEKFNQKEKEREEAVIKKGDNLAAVVKEVGGMTEDEAVKQYGDQGRRIKRGELTPEERTTLEEGDTARRLGVGQVDRMRTTEGLRKGAAAEYGLDQKLGLDKTGGGNIMVGDADKILGKTPQPAATTPAPQTRTSGPAKVQIEDQDALAQSLARALGRTQLNVKVSGDASGSRGPLSLPPPAPSGG